jgi:hypothetical protein
MRSAPMQRHDVDQIIHFLSVFHMIVMLLTSHLERFYVSGSGECVAGAVW